MLSERIKELAESNGIDTIGFTNAKAFSHYLLPNSVRREPHITLSGAKSIIVAGVYIGGLTLSSWNKNQYGRTSRLYLSEFFLDVVKPLEPLVSLLQKEGYHAVLCDSSQAETSIIPLKLAAQRAGLGWQGKHSLLISKKYGTFLALGGIITDAELVYHENPVPDLCKDCQKCRDACPLGALDKPYVLDMNNCLSYLLQVESLPEEAERAMENRVGDCEICQLACPWNKRHITHPLQTPLTLEFEEKKAYWEDLFYLPRLVNMTEKEYRAKLGGLNTTIPYDIFYRNVVLAARENKPPHRSGH